MKMAQCLTPQDFPSICRICLENTKLKPSSEEKYLSDIFTSITNIKIQPHDNLPKNICLSCLNKIDEISIFINVSKLNNSEFLQKLARDEEHLCLQQENEIIIVDDGTSIKIEENSELDLQTEALASNEANEISQLGQCNRRRYTSMFRYVCRLCVARKNLKNFSEHRQLMNVFRSITKIAVSPEDKLPQHICCQCIQKLQDASSLIELSKTNDKKLHHILSNQQKHQYLDNSTEITNYGIHSEIKIEDDIISLETDSDGGEEPENSVANGTDEEVESHSTQGVGDQNSIHVSECDNDANQSNIHIVVRDISIPIMKTTRHLRKDRGSRHQKKETETNGAASIWKCDICNEEFSSVSKQKHMDSHSYNAQSDHRLKPLKIVLVREKLITEMVSLLGDKRLGSQDQRRIPNISEVAKERETSKSIPDEGRKHSNPSSFECYCCQQKFAVRRYLVNHMKIHSGVRPYQCNICYQTFTQAGSLTKHRDAIHLQKRDFQCSICLNCYPTRHRLKLHMDTHNTEKRFKCSICQKSFIMEDYLRRHMILHAPKEHFECQICSKVFNRRSNLKNHLKIHAGRELTFECADCSKGFFTKADLVKHVVVHSVHRPYKCSTCPMDFRTERALKKHMLRHQERERSYHCTLCPKSFTHPTNLKNHLKIHKGDKQIKCKFCNKRFYHNSEMLSHQRVHTGEKPYSCTLCPKRFSHSGSLALHLSWHSGERPFKCTECGMSFRKRSYVKIHMRTHTGERPYKCEICNKNFAHDNSLRNHRATHEAVKPFECSVCAKRCAHPSDLKVHMRTHTGEKPYKCPICPSRFPHSATLKIHLRRHKGEKPYTCGICSTSFVTKSDLKGHLNNKHKSEEFSCDICSKTFSKRGNLSKHVTRAHNTSTRRKRV